MKEFSEPLQLSMASGGEEIASDRNEHKDISTTKEQVLEQARAERAGIMGGVLARLLKKIDNSPLLHKLINLTPGLGDIKMMHGVIKGTEGGRELTAGERLNYALAAASGIFVLANLMQGEFATAAAAEAVSSVLTKFDVAIAAIQQGAASSDKKYPRLARVMGAVATFLMQKRDEAAMALATTGKNMVTLLKKTA